MIGIDLAGIISTALLVGPKYFAYVSLAVVIQEAARLLMALGLGNEVSEVWLAGFFGYASGASGSAITYGVLGPMCSLVLGLCMVGLPPPTFRSLLNPAGTYRRPLGAVLLKLALGSLLVTVWRFIAK